MTFLPVVFQILLILLVIPAAFYDVKWRRIPNWLVLAGLLAGLALNTFLFELPGLKVSLFGIAFASFIYIPLYALRAMGAGDAKLMMALGAIAGAGPWLGIFFFTAILGGVIAVALLLRRRLLGNTLRNVGFILFELAHLRAPYMGREELDVNNPAAVTCPHGLTVAIGTCGFLAATAIWGR